MAERKREGPVVFIESDARWSFLSYNKVWVTFCSFQDLQVLKVNAAPSRWFYGPSYRNQNRDTDT